MTDYNNDEGHLFGGIAKRPTAADCKSVIPHGGSNPPSPTNIARLAQRWRSNSRVKRRSLVQVQYLAPLKKIDMKSSEVLYILFKEKDLELMNKNRLKAFKRSCYQFVGNRFYCCEHRCEIQLNDDKTKLEYEIFQTNINNISKSQKRFI